MSGNDNIPYYVNTVFRNSIGALSSAELRELRDYFAYHIYELESGRAVNLELNYLYVLREVCKKDGRLVKQATDELKAYARKLSTNVKRINASCVNEKNTYQSVFNEFELRCPEIEATPTSYARLLYEPY